MGLPGLAQAGFKESGREVFHSVQPRCPASQPERSGSVERASDARRIPECGALELLSAGGNARIGARPRSRPSQFALEEAFWKMGTLSQAEQSIFAVQAPAKAVG